MKRNGIKKKCYKAGSLVLAGLISASLCSLATDVNDFEELKSTLSGTSGVVNFTDNIIATEVLDVISDFVFNGDNKNITTDGGYHRAFLVKKWS